MPAAGRGRPQTAMRCVAARPSSAGQPGPPQAQRRAAPPPSFLSFLSALPPSARPRPPQAPRSPAGRGPLTTAARPGGSRPRPRPCGAGRSCRGAALPLAVRNCGSTLPCAAASLLRADDAAALSGIGSTEGVRSNASVARLS